MTDPVPPDLQRLLKQAAHADPSERIDLRDPIASFGEAAVVAVEPWVADRRLGAFAVRVIEAVAKGDDRAAALAALSRAAATAGSPTFSGTSRIPGPV